MSRCYYGIIDCIYSKNNIETDEIKQDPWANDSSPRQYFLQKRCISHDEKRKIFIIS